MKHAKSLVCSVVGLLALVGCGAGDDGGSANGATDTADAPLPLGMAPNAELARVEFADGNVVRFNELHGGVMISEVGSNLNRPHLIAKDGLRALDAFKSLAPGRAVPLALSQMHERMYPAGAVQKAGPNTGAPASEEAADPELEHDGEFQQFLPAANFLQQMCNFPLTSPSYKHTNRTDAHQDVSLSIHSAYFAVGSDLGAITAEACAGKNTGGIFNGSCGKSVLVTAGTQTSGVYDAGQSCSTGCQIFGTGCVTICSPKQVRFETHFVNVNPSVRFHECAQLTR